MVKRKNLYALTILVIVAILAVVAFIVIRKHDQPLRTSTSYQDSIGFLHKCTQPIAVKEDPTSLNRAGTPTIVPVHESEAKKYCKKTGAME